MGRLYARRRNTYTHVTHTLTSARKRAGTLTQTRVNDNKNNILLINIITDNIRLIEIIADYDVTKEADDDNDNDDDQEEEEEDDDNEADDDDDDDGNYDRIYLNRIFKSMCRAFIPSDIRQRRPWDDKPEEVGRMPKIVPVVRQAREKVEGDCRRTFQPASSRTFCKLFSIVLSIFDIRDHNFNAYY